MCQQSTITFAAQDGSVPSRARAFCAEWISAALPEGDERVSVIDTTALAVSELVTNSVKANAKQITVELDVHHDRIHLAVRDDGIGRPQPRDAAPNETTGRGLAIVAALGRSWGVNELDDGKQVWVELPLPDTLTGIVTCLPSDDAHAPAEITDRLHNLLSVTDITLSRLDVDDLLVELLDRIRGILDADTAAVLLREPGANYLVARAAVGLEEEVRQGVRVPIGAGFAGSIAARRQPVVLTRVDASTVANPILWEKGIEVMLGAPLLSGDDVLGVLHVGRLEHRDFGADDVELLQVAAERVTGNLQSRRLAVEGAAARMLERGLLPTRLPQVDGLQFAARYAPAEQHGVGGDWYDAFKLPTGELWLVVGDVAGHGLNAAVVMGRVKSALRSYALLGDPPNLVLEHTDRKVQHFEIGSLVTVLVAVARPPYECFELCSAGHLPPVLATPGQAADLADIVTGPPLGAVSGATRRSTTVDLPPGGVLLLYTDGLVERRTESVTSGLDRLTAAVPCDHPESVCQAVMHRMVGGASFSDDVALLAVRNSRRDEG